MAPVPGNPYAFLEHDGLSEGYREGFRPRTIHWLYRFRHNLNPTCLAVGTGTSHNPTVRRIHWLEASTLRKMKTAVLSEDCFPHTLTWIAAILFSLWQILWYLYDHPDVSLYYLVMWTTKPFVRVSRSNELHPMEKPVFRYFQGASDYYLPHLHREMVKAGLAVNDPWVEHCKREGIFEDLTKYPHELNRRLWPPSPRGKSEGGKM